MTIIRQQNRPRKRRLAPTIWSILILGALAAVAGFLVLHPERLPGWAERTSLGRQLQTTEVYKWQDPDGAWHVSDRPPPAGVEYQVESYSRDDNVLPLPPGLER